MEKIDLNSFEYEVMGHELYIDTGYIHFTVKREKKILEFKLKLYKGNEGWEPIDVIHFANQNVCPYCDAPVYVYCTGFRSLLWEFYEALKRDPKLRLRFLFE